MDLPDVLAVGNDQKQSDRRSANSHPHTTDPDYDRNWRLTYRQRARDARVSFDSLRESDFAVALMNATRVSFERGGMPAGNSGCCSADERVIPDTSFEAKFFGVR